ncbi:Histone acetyltransferase type B subunit 2 [Apiospora arundinis]
MCYQVVELYSACRCLYYQHANKRLVAVAAALAAFSVVRGHDRIMSTSAPPALRGQ